MSERFEMHPENFVTIDFPYKLKNLEAFDLTTELMRDPRFSKHLDFLKKHHLPTYEHCVRVGTLSADLGMENGYEEEETAIIAGGGLLHDLGKCYIPLEILSKDSPLTKEELNVIHTHTRLGFDMLKEPEYNGIREIVVAHHEFRNGNSYPRSEDHERGGRRRGKPGDHEHAAMVAAADVFDALSVKRPYNPEFSLPEIEQIIRKDYSGNPKYIEQIIKRYKAKE